MHRSQTVGEFFLNHVSRISFAERDGCLWQATNGVVFVLVESPFEGARRYSERSERSECYLLGWIPHNFH